MNILLILNVLCAWSFGLRVSLPGTVIPSLTATYAVNSSNQLEGEFTMFPSRGTIFTRGRILYKFTSKDDLGPYFLTGIGFMKAQRITIPTIHTGGGIMYNKNKYGMFLEAETIFMLRKARIPYAPSLNFGGFYKPTGN